MAELATEKVTRASSPRGARRIDDDNDSAHAQSKPRYCEKMEDRFPELPETDLTSLVDHDLADQLLQLELECQEHCQI